MDNTEKTFKDTLQDYCCIKWQDDNGINHVMRGTYEQLLPHIRNIKSTGFEASLINFTEDKEVRLWI